MLNLFKTFHLGRMGILFTSFIFFGSLLNSCRKTMSYHNTQDQTYNRSVKGYFEPGEITQWNNWYISAVKNAPALLFAKAEQKIIKGRYYMRIPLENTSGMLYFTKTTSLQSIFIRQNFKGHNIKNSLRNLEFIDINRLQFRVVTFKNSKPDSVYDAVINKSANQQTLNGLSKQTNGTFWFDLGCILSFGIPIWDDNGDRVCMGLNLWDWVANLFDGGGGSSSGEGSSNFGAVWAGPGPDPGIGVGTGIVEGSGGSGFGGAVWGPYVPVFAGDPTELQDSWEAIDSDFYMETGGDDDPGNSNVSGPIGSIPHSIQLNNGSVVQVDFGTTDDGDNADHQVSQRLIDGLIAALNVASQSGIISKIYIKATTNGSHSNPNSNHYRGTAVDISRINNVPMILSGPNTIVTALQNALDQVPYRRENFGPAFKHKFGVPYTIDGHKDHIHFSVDGY